MKTRIMKRKTVVYFVLPSFLLLFLTLFSFIFYPFVKYVWGQSDRYCINTIIQRKPLYDSLKCSLLSEILGLSASKKNYLYHFDMKEGEEKLKSTIFIKDAHIKKLKPSTLFVEYVLREPIAVIGNYSNVAIDEEGVFFPLTFYTPKNLPEIILSQNAKEMKFGCKLNEEELKIVRTFFDTFFDLPISLIDLSKLNAKTLGEKEIVLKVKDEHFLRLTPRNASQEIGKYFLLRKNAMNAINNHQMIDLRIPHVAIIGGT